MKRKKCKTEKQEFPLKSPAYYDRLFKAAFISREPAAGREWAARTFLGAW